MALQSAAQSSTSVRASYGDFLTGPRVLLVAVVVGKCYHGACGQIWKPSLVPNISFNFKDAIFQNVCTGHGLPV